MKKGFEFAQTYGCEISYTLENELNAWSVNIQNIPAELAPGASLVYEYNLCIIDKIPDKTSEKKIIPEKAFDKFKFTKLKPVEIKNAPVSQEGQITIKDVILNLNKPKVRGLNLRAGMSDALTDLKTLKECGCNLVVTDMATPDETRKVVRRGHEYGMEMFMPGEGSYSSGLPPSFDSFFQTNPIPEECPDAYGQDEDHYYWYPVKPTLNFETEFGKLMSEASLEEKVIYWSRCFADKWEKTLMSIRDHDPTGNIWFYMPAPSIANIDPFNFYDQFFTEISKLNNVLTVFPFYYGTDYDQIEYMVRKWKAVDVKRVVFLPMRWYMAKPGQFIRAITAARRGGADGSCGFNFAVGAEEPGQEWQWKSVMLAAQANFPTPELNACCFIEEPAELVELLAIKDIIVVSMESDIREFGQSLKSLLPGRVRVVKDLPDDHSKSEKMYVIIGDDKKPVEGMWVYDIGQLKKGSGKGVIQMSGNIVRLNGSDSIGLMNAEELFLRFAELAPAENKN